MFPAHTKHTRKGTISGARDMGSILSNSLTLAQSPFRDCSSTDRVMRALSTIRKFRRAPKEARRHHGCTSRERTDAMAGAVTESECAQALAEFRAQRTALDRARDAARRLRFDQLEGARPAVWRTTAAAAYSSRLNSLSDELGQAIAAIDLAIDRVDAAMADVVADIPESLGAVNGERLR